jgi:hypothetical protein
MPHSTGMLYLTANVAASMGFNGFLLQIPVDSKEKMKRL